MSDVPVGVFLSGGLDSSIIAGLLSRQQRIVHTFAAGMAGASDLSAARVAAAHLGTFHEQVVFTRDDILEALPDIIFHLESFDLPLVRSAIPNYFVARLAHARCKVVLTGEGADELFAGYTRYKALSDGGMLQDALLESTRALYNTNLQRTDRMTMAFGIEARVPFLDTALVEFALGLPPEWKSRRVGQGAKQLLRDAFHDILLDGIASRGKEKFSVGAGNAAVMHRHAEDTISNETYLRETAEAPVPVRSKEELLYYRIYVGYFGHPLAGTEIGRTVMTDS